MKRPHKLIRDADNFSEKMNIPRTQALRKSPLVAPLMMLLDRLKHDGEKVRMELLDPYAVEQLAAVLTFGAKKYAPHNWRLGIRKGRLLAALMRHVFAYLRGEDKDPETGLSHIAHAMCCCMFILGLEHRIDLDDRYKE